jgi:hypothetical protein
LISALKLPLLLLINDVAKPIREPPLMFAPSSLAPAGQALIELTYLNHGHEESLAELSLWPRLPARAKHR